MRFFLALLSVCVVPFVLLPESNAQCLPKANSVQYERFSSVTQVQTMDSKPSTLFAGIELVLEENSDRVSATLRDYDGTPIPLTSRLEGRLQESRDGSCMATVAYFAHRNGWGSDAPFSWPQIGSAALEVFIVLAFPLVVWLLVVAGVSVNMAVCIGLVVLLAPDWYLISPP